MNGRLGGCKANIPVIVLSILRFFLPLLESNHFGAGKIAQMLRANSIQLTQLYRKTKKLTNEYLPVAVGVELEYFSEVTAL